ncbi:MULTISPECIES: FAD-dependent monooxygenase [Kitasatospora]|uniref:Putative monooxygenase n=1 Tax=Kitasatospora setae (strain ATCC 33774 / DSM 43861 / JCM 3304 / KCC A-0304 / NBRC 14216 / KM-6054) TaxID=452652 RepID=E4NJ15_KITSK|nr:MULTISPECIES: FAD-dependent monooxygenase [Kitasatospora]BAJ32963.1 putative monooxygenase [Kitasatospora setae KM-6054]
MKNTETSLDILVSGAGIAGPALAYWLRRKGFRPVVVERAPAPRPGGQTVDLRGAGRTVIERMGLLERVRELAVDQRGIALVDRRGRHTARLPTELFGGEGIVSDLEILRGDLADLLYEATADEVEYLFDDTLTALHQDADGVHAVFENAPPRRFDLVVGADGLHSTTRRLAFGPERDFVTPLDCHTAWFTARTALDLDGWFLMYNAPGGLVVSARPGRLPGEVKAAFAFRSGPLTHDRRDRAAQQRLLTERFAGRGWESDRLLAAMAEADDFHLDSMGQVRLDSHSRGRVALIGDAACCPTPLTGLGTSLALVGAYLLAHELAAAGGDHTTAYAAYQRQMRPYAAKAQQLPPGGVAGYAPTSAAVIRLRAASMRWMTRRPLRRLMEAQAAKASEVALPAYDAAPAPVPAPGPRTDADTGTGTGTAPVSVG